MMYNKARNKQTDGQHDRQRGRLITFEGIDGSGKTTQIAHLSDSLGTAGIHVITLREPGGTAISEAVRDILLDLKHTGMFQETELLLFAAARAQLVREVFLPSLAKGHWIICDRYYDSTMAYQGYGRGLDLQAIRAINALATDQCRPDMTLLLDLPAELAAERMSQRSTAADRIDQENRDFMRRVRTGYLAIAAEEPERIIRMDAGQAEEALAQQIHRQIWEGFGI
ncbi:MAG: dTMP kinase [Eubacteriales bacterium]|nr:dTMP kinase [Eubacteriales bacterium]MDD3866391.1 dTMP kinase [Eubacteriales bacterium]MDD4461286.1 dTMP kinase [Eubacteriales bacterium]